MKNKTVPEANSDHVKVIVAGINGRMGRASAQAIMTSEQFQLVGAFGRPGAPYQGQDIAELVPNLGKTGIMIAESLAACLSEVAADVILDFSLAAPAVENAMMAMEHGVRPVIGTSGLKPEDVQKLSEMAARMKLGALVVPNFSVGAVLMMEFSRQAASMFEHAEIVEMHHTGKVDAPSGTAMNTMRKMAATAHPFNSSRTVEHELLAGARGGKGDAGIRIHSLRLPGLISHQEVFFAADGELLTIRHDSFNTNCFITGILLSLKAVIVHDRLVVGLDAILKPETAKVTGGSQ